MKAISFLPDRFTLALIGAVSLASVLPVQGQAARAFDWLTTVAIAVVFFLHGTKLSRKAIIDGATHWRLHALVLGCTFIFFPLIGFVLKPVLVPLIGPALYAGFLLLCTVPSTVQSSIAFTSIAKGNVSAAVFSASASSLAGIFLTPALMGVLVAQQGTVSPSSWHTVVSIITQLLLPFLGGHLLRPLVYPRISHRTGLIRFVDQGSIVLVVYAAFSAAVVQGLWHEIPVSALAWLVLATSVLLALALTATRLLAKRMGFERDDRIAIIFCGSKKSLAAGVPIAKVVFAGHTAGALLLPLMVFHQIQLMVCAVLARRWGNAA